MTERLIDEIDKQERIYMGASFLMIVGAVVALIISIVGHHASLPVPAGRVDPEKLSSTAPFDEPGLYETGPGTYDLVMVAQAWSWTPSEVTVPKGATVRVVATSRDVVHGMRITDTNVNVMMIPGQISEVEFEVKVSSEMHLICHEYCGIGHQGMFARILVEGEV